MIQVLLKFGGYVWLAEVALVIFVLAFLAVVGWVFTRSRSRIEYAARLPLEDCHD